MTTGNTRPTPARPESPTRERFVATALELIAEEGGSLHVNLRQISRRMGCAHTNVYNYFDSYQDLLWATFRRAIRVYGGRLTEGLDVSMPAMEYLQRTIRNLASFPEQNPGLYRFIGSDPIDLASTPDDILETVTAMKHWFAAAIEAAADSRVGSKEAREAADIVLAYIDGETLNLINGRAIPSEDLRGRVVANALRLFDLLAGGDRPRRAAPPDPSLVFGTGAGPA